MSLLTVCDMVYVGDYSKMAFLSPCMYVYVYRNGVLHFLSVELDRVMFSQVCSVCLQ